MPIKSSGLFADVERSRAQAFRHTRHPPILVDRPAAGPSPSQLRLEPRVAPPMPAAVACLRCGAPVFAEDRFCGSCGSARTPAPTPEITSPGAAAEKSAYSARLLAMLRHATMGEYEIRGEIGRGGMAAVYLAYDLRLNRKVAIKVMLPELAFHEGMEDRFKREARTAAKLDHPNIVVIYSVRDDAEMLYFVMKYIEGASLEQLIHKYKPLPLPLAQYVLVQLAGALQYAHDEGIVHRDVKPANVLIDRRGNALVTDFGIAKATEAPNLTRTGSIIGTPAYMSPEQCMGNEQTHASDQYSLGIVAYELIAGRPPFTGPMVELQWAHVKTEPPPLLDARPDCPLPVASAVMQMLRKDPTDRWPSLHDAIASLATGLIPGDESPRRKLAEMLRIAAPVPTDGIAITPASPVPQSRGSGRAAPASNAPRVTPVTPGERTPVTPVERTPVAPVDRTPMAPVHRTPATPVVAPPSPTVTSIHVVPLDEPLEVGMTHRMKCEVRDAQGRAMPDEEVDWASSNPGVASVTASGEVTAVAVGKTTLAATAQAHTSTLTIEVIPDRVAEVVLTPASLTVEERTSGRLSVRANNGRGQAIAGRQVTLESADARVATVAPDGVVTAKTVGRTRITATLEGRTTTAEIVVRPAAVSAMSVTPQSPSTVAGMSISFAAALRDAGGQALSGRSVAWHSSDPRTLTIDQTGRAVAVKAGTVDVTAESEGVKAVVRVTVAPPALAELWIVQPSSAVRQGKRVKLRARARDTTGRELEPDGVVWRSNNSPIATIAADGALSGVAPGDVSVTAVVGTRQATVSLTVVAAPPPPRIPLSAVIGGGAVVMAVVAVLLFARGSDDTVIPPPGGTDTAIVPSNPPTVDTPVAQTPPIDSTPKTSPLGATPPDTVVRSLRIATRGPILLESGQASRLAARAATASGSAAPSARITWTSADPTIAAVSANGTVTGRAEGRTSVTATTGGLTANVDVVVSRPAPAAVTISQRTASVKVGEQTTLSARVRDRTGSTLDYAVVWRSANAGVATVDNGGTVRGVRQGDVVISALAGGATDSITVTVTAVAVVANPQPPIVTPPQPRPEDRPPASGGNQPASGGANAPNTPTPAEIDPQLIAAAQAIANGFARGQVGLLKPTSQFAKTVSDDRPQVVGSLEVRRRTIGDGKADGDVAVPLRWKTFTGSVKNAVVVLHITLERQGGSWRATSATNTNNP